MQSLGHTSISTLFSPPFPLSWPLGLQVWKGALMMMECLTGWRDRVDGAILVELGGGPGLPSIYASKYLSPSKVYCTGKS